MPGERSRRGVNGRKAIAKERVWELRLARVPFSRIAKEVGISKGYAFKLYREALDEHADRTAALADRYVAEQVEQIDRLIMAHWSTRGDPQSANVILRCLDQRAKLQGLNTTRVVHEGQVDVVHEDAEERRRRILEQTADQVAMMTPEELAREAAGL